MVASGIAQFPIPNAVVQRMGYGPVKFTIDDALRMVQQGILPEDSRIELLDGSLVYRDRFDLRGDSVVEGVRHNYVIGALGQLSIRVNTSTRYMRTQSTVLCSETHAPIPDAVILRGPLDEYRDRLPTASDVCCLIEVSDSSYERDAGEKLSGYARAEVRQYIIVNLRNRTAEVRSRPNASAGTYESVEIVGQGELLLLQAGESETFSVPLRELFPRFTTAL